ncbi:hypothetical protein CVT24_012787 [Panaeolus cyanescens]|uniref:AB hydrolase-1 domain-containing protein n=1 Tax=Panaeolus cyanescens TaxID=181874 RepID=A0A409WKU5_9AGAR|nr:hypothetical protein CVT24_012787 [Panaeolus cyanescens]
MGALYSVLAAPSDPPKSYPIIHFAEEPAELEVKTEDGSEKLSLRTLIETRCQSLFTSFQPLWWMANGHLQTLYCVLGSFGDVDRMTYNRTYLRLADGGTIGLDFAPVDQSSLDPDTPIVCVQHGLTGGSYEPYVRAVLSRACAPVTEGGLGYRAVVINFRGCAGVPITSQMLYSAGQTDDTRLALAHVASLYPNAPLLGLGFSLGSNVMTRYLGEEGLQTRLYAACALACPWDLRQNNHGLLNSFLGKHVYSKGMGANLSRLLQKHLMALIEDPDHEVAKAAHAAMQLKNPTLEKFDDTFTRIAGGPKPHFPFRDADEYYRWGSSHDMVKKVTVPFLAINAADDPVVRHVPMDGGGNGLVVMELTDRGGHLGWFQAGPGYIDRWTTKPVLEWLKLVGNDIIHEKRQRGPEMFVDDDGFTRERGREHLGFKVLPGGGPIDGNGGEDGMFQGL